MVSEIALYNILDFILCGYMFGVLEEDVLWSSIVGIGSLILVNFIYYWYLVYNGNKKY